MITEEEYRNAAITQYKQGNYEECVNICNGAIKNNLLSGSIYNVKSLAAMSLKQYDEAYNEYKIAVKQEAKFAELLSYLAVIVSENKEEEKRRLILSKNLFTEIGNPEKIIEIEKILNNL